MICESCFAAKGNSPGADLLVRPGCEEFGVGDLSKLALGRGTLAPRDAYARTAKHISRWAQISGLHLQTGWCNFLCVV
eukprot:11113187-Alexandrium_andersonii.AAC.1